MAGEFVSGSDILSNAGNAALGYSSGVEYNANPMDTNPFGTVQSTLSSLQAQDASRREAMRQQALQEQKDLADYLIGSGKSAFNLQTPDGQGAGFSPLEEDRQILNSAADDLRRSIMANPRKWKFDPDILKKRAEFDQLTRQASLRSVDVSKKLALAAAANNPEERDRIMQNVEGVRKSGLSEFKTPEPYLPPPTFDINKIYSADILSGKNKEAWQTYKSTAGVDENGNEVQVDMVGMAPQELDIRQRMKRGSAEYAEGLNYVNSFYASPQSRDPNVIAQMNRNIDVINQQRGYEPGSPHFIPHLAVPLPNGQIQSNALSVPDAAYSLLAEAYGGLAPQQQLKRTASQIAKEKSDMAIDHERLNNERQRIAIDRKKAEKEGRAEDAEALAAQAEALKVIEMVAPDKNTPNANIAFSRLPLDMRTKVAAQMGIPEKSLQNYLVKVLAPEELSVKHLAGLQYGGTGSGVEKPDIVMAITPKDGSVQDTKVIVSYKKYEDILDKEGVPEMEGTKPKQKKVDALNIMSLSDAVGTYVRAANRFQALQGRVDKAKQYTENYFGGTQDQATAGAPQQQPAAPTPKPAGPTKKIPPAPPLPEPIKKLGPAFKSAKPVWVEGLGQWFWRMGENDFYDANGNKK